MKKYIFALLSAAALGMAGCSDDVLDRPQLTAPVDNNFWRNETDIRLYVNDFYINYFVGYNSGWGTAYAPLRGYYVADDFASSGKQSTFENSIPSSRGATTETPTMLDMYAGPNWNFAYVRKVNILLDRLENRAKANLSAEQYNHWHGVADFLKAYEYTRLVSVFGAVPYFEKELKDTDKEEMYKDRDAREVVMDKVYDLLASALENVREDDGVQRINRYLVAGFASRFMLFEGTWQKYHANDQARAKKYLELAQSAANYVMASGKYAIDAPFREVFGSQNLSSNKEMLMYRHYDDAKSVTHHVASYSNGYEAQSPAPNLALAKSFICADGKPYQSSLLTDASKLDITNMVKTRDPRFEATFWNGPKIQSSTLLYACKFIDRVGVTYWEGTIPPMYGSMTNTNDAPVFRYAEVLLNWIEAKAELATMGGAAVTQADINASINVLRNRPLDAEAISEGIQKTAPMQLADINDAFDPERDPTVPALIWEIRRERRMEFVYEHSRLLDIKRWKKLDYMDNIKYPDTGLGLWINIKEELPSFLVAGKVGKLKVQKADGTVVTYDGTNGDELVGFYIPEGYVARDIFTDRSYLAPIGIAQINDYEQRGYTLSQTTGW
ncbi:MAG: RagB/SusD family nutrient uptake outer membrane protein [Bacteroidales bacterium]